MLDPAILPKHPRNINYPLSRQQVTALALLAFGSMSRCVGGYVNRGKVVMPIEIIVGLARRRLVTIYGRKHCAVLRPAGVRRLEDEMLARVHRAMRGR
jgi:hypothetical protein